MGGVADVTSKAEAELVDITKDGSEEPKNGQVHRDTSFVFAVSFVRIHCCCCSDISRCGAGTTGGRCGGTSCCCWIVTGARSVEHLVEVVDIDEFSDTTVWQTDAVLDVLENCSLVLRTGANSIFVNAGDFYANVKASKIRSCWIQLSENVVSIVDRRYGVKGTLLGARFEARVHSEAKVRIKSLQSITERNAAIVQSSFEPTPWHGNGETTLDVEV